jgi:transcriptional regulator with XRE-family HTH domain
MQRLSLGMSQTNLADELGVTFQQVQKYEKGANRISASRLQHIASVLRVPVAFFFDGGPNQFQSSGSDPASRHLSRFLAASDGRALARAFSRLPSAKMRRVFLKLVMNLAEREAR